MSNLLAAATVLQTVTNDFKQEEPIFDYCTDEDFIKCETGGWSKNEHNYWATQGEKDPNKRYRLKDVETRILRVTASLLSKLREIVRKEPDWKVQE